MKFRTRTTGVLKQDKTYFTYRSKNQYFHKYMGFGLSTHLLLQLRKQGCKKIIIIYQETENTCIKYSVHPDLFLHKGIIYNNKGDYQRVLPLKYFDEE